MKHFSPKKAIMPIVTGITLLSGLAKAQSSDMNIVVTCSHSGEELSYEINNELYGSFSDEKQIIVDASDGSTSLSTQNDWIRHGICRMSDSINNECLVYYAEQLQTTMFDVTKDVCPEKSEIGDSKKLNVSKKVPPETLDVIYAAYQFVKEEALSIRKEAEENNQKKQNSTDGSTASTDATTRQSFAPVVKM